MRTNFNIKVSLVVVLLEIVDIYFTDSLCFRNYLWNGGHIYIISSFNISQYLHL